MATATIQVAYEAETTSLKATVNEINQINDKVVQGAQESAGKVKKEYTGIANSFAAAFSGGEVKKALDNQAKAIDNVGKSGKSLSGQLRELKGQLAQLEIAGQDGTDAFNELLIAAAKLEDQIGDTRDRVKILASDTFKFDAAVGATQALASGFELAQGAATLFGAENEDLQKAIAKVTAATAVANGVQQLSSLIKEESAIKTAVLTGAQTAYNVVVGTSTGLMKAFRIALASTGVGLLVIGLVLLIENFEKIKDAIMGTSDATRAFEAAQKSANAELAKSKTTLKDLSDTQADLNEKLLVAQGKLSKEQAEINKTQRDATKKNIDDIRSLVAEREKLNAAIKSQKVELIEAQKLSDSLTGREGIRYKEAVKANLDNANQQLKISTDLRDKLTANIDATLKANIKAAKTEVTIINAEAEKDAADKRAELIKAANAKALDEAKKAAEDQAKAREQLAAKELQLFESQLSAEDKIRSDSNKEVIELEKQFAASRFKAGSDEELAAAKTLADAIAVIRENANNQIAAVDKATNEKLLAERLEAAKAAEGATLTQQLEALENQEKIELAAAESVGAKEADIKKKYAGQIADIKASIADQTLNDEINKLKTLEITEGSSLENRIKLIEADSKKRIAAAGNDAEAIKLINAETQAAITEENNKETQKRVDLVFEYADAIVGLFNTINELSKQASENRIADITASSEAELNAINASTDLERDKARQRAALEVRTQRAIANEKTKQAKQDKNLALFNIAIATAEAVIKSIAASPESFGLPFSAFAAAAGLAQAAVVAAKPLPKFEKGGVVGGSLHSGGGTMVEAERDEYIVNRRQSMRHRRELDAINSSSDAFRRLIEERYVRPALMDYVAGNRNKQGVTVNASLNSKSMEKELRGMRKDLSKRNMTININQQDSRYLWQ
jgi:hypothetical protein